MMKGTVDVLLMRARLMMGAAHAYGVGVTTGSAAQRR
jgi:hypothetical protein